MRLQQGHDRSAKPHICLTGAAQPAVRGLEFAIQPGETFGFLGPSGAGKSTTQWVLIGLLLVPNLAWFFSGGWPALWPAPDLLAGQAVLGAGSWEPGAWRYLVVGWLYQLLLLAYLLRRFNKIMHQ
jgi:hypothetical protein